LKIFCQSNSKVSHVFETILVQRVFFVTGQGAAEWVGCSVALVTFSVTYRLHFSVDI